MPVVPFGDIVCARATADFAVETGAIPVKVRFAVTGRVDVGLITLVLRGLFAYLIASFMALAPVRSANRAMALSERWSERLKIAAYERIANKARQCTGRRGEKVAIKPPASGIGKYLIWPALHLFDSAHTDRSGVFQAGVRSSKNSKFALAETTIGGRQAKLHCRSTIFSIPVG
jgi:hypothetical protein